ncbi:unnamed protein product [Scytosiphon promiscuus]
MWLNSRATEQREAQQRLFLAANQPPPPPVNSYVMTPAPTAGVSVQGNVRFEMFCPNSIAGQVIGRGGQTVKRLMEESGAWIVVKTYADRTGHDVVISGFPQAVQVARLRVEQLYRSLGCEPTLLPPPMPARRAADAAARARLPYPNVPPEVVIGHPGRGIASTVGRGAGPEAGPGVTLLRRATPPPPPEAGPGVTLLRRTPPAQPPAAGEGAGGGGSGELPGLLRAAQCEHHLERFRLEQLDGEVLLEMERRDFDRMGVTEAEQERILSVLKRADGVGGDGGGDGGGGGGGPAAADDDEDSDGLDPDHPDTCKICMDAIVGILFLPCRHQCTCARCGAGYEGKPCILCRQKVVRAQKVIKLGR